MKSKMITGFFAEPFSRKKRLAGQGQRPCRRPQTVTALCRARSAWGELQNSPVDCFARGDCPVREGVPLPCGKVSVLNPPAERRIDIQRWVYVWGFLVTPSAFVCERFAPFGHISINLIGAPPLRQKKIRTEWCGRIVMFNSALYLSS